MKDLADMARGMTEFKRMMESGDGSSPLSALADIVKTLSSIYEELVKLNKNLEQYNSARDS